MLHVRDLNPTTFAYPRYIGRYLLPPYSILPYSVERNNGSSRTTDHTVPHSFSSLQATLHVAGVHGGACPTLKDTAVPHRLHP